MACQANLRDENLEGISLLELNHCFMMANLQQECPQNLDRRTGHFFTNMENKNQLAWHPTVSSHKHLVTVLCCGCFSKKGGVDQLTWLPGNELRYSVGQRSTGVWSPYEFVLGHLRVCLSKL